MIPDNSLTDRQNYASGSSNPGEPDFIIVGKFGRPHGVKGEITFQPMTDFPERLHAGKTLLVGRAHQEYKIKSIREKGQDFILQFEQITSREAAQLLTNQYAYVAVASLPPLPEDEYYHHELLGILVFNPDGDRLGVLTEILETGANDVYVVTADDGEELLLPVIPSVILHINIKEKKMIVKPQDWV